MYSNKLIIIGTGGTIAGQSATADDLTGYHAGELSVESLVTSVPGLAEYGPFESKQFCNIDSSDMTVKRWQGLAQLVQAYVDRPDVDGVVITHGTDTMEETAYFLHLTVHTNKPIICTGSMRPASAISAEGPLNLLQAVQTARSKEAWEQGVLVVLNGAIDCARDVHKAHTTAVETFESPYFGHMGFVQEGVPRFYYKSLRKHTASSQFAVAKEGKGHENELIDEACDLPLVISLTLYADMPAAILDGVLALKPKGLVLGGLGHGILPEVIHQKVSHIEIPVVRASRTGSGMVSSGSSLGTPFIVSDTLTPQKARILLMLGLCQTDNIKELQELFYTY
ncbi:asparaginase [uncultured Veillonella sp.]|uniref:asparaginase n=1 Tax=uncultured Veillonella sp. TaxID=159268 RepID=UPI0025F7F014|nr:asparaginase [uncultured Veillonella sp.]